MPIKHSQFNESGRPVIDETACSACGRCAMICPADVLKMRGERVVVDTSGGFGCIACGHCMMVCSTGGITVTGRGVSPEDLVELSPHGFTPEQLEAFLLGRRSVRRFDSRPVERLVLERVVAMAATAPMGIPPWDVGVTVVEGRPRVRELAGRVVGMYEKMGWLFSRFALGLMRPLLGKVRYEVFSSFLSPLRQALVDGRAGGRDVLFWDAPALMIFHTSPYTDVGDAMIACTYAMLAAHSLGLGTCMIGSAAPMMQRNRALCEAYGVPRENKPQIVLLVGWPRETFARGIRRRFASVNYV